MRGQLTRPWSRRLAASAFAVAALTGISACSAGDPTSSDTRANGQHLAAEDFATAMDAPGTTVLDVRTPAEYAAGHLPRAQNIDVEGPDFASRIAGLDKAGSYAVYCQSGNRSGVALEQMAAAGFTQAYDLSGGIGAWQDMGGPIELGGP